MITLVYLLLEEFLSNIISVDDIPMKKVTYFIWSYFLIELLSHFAIICLKFRHKKITHFIYYIHVFLSMNQWYMIFLFFFMYHHDWLTLHFKSMNPHRRTFQPDSPYLCRKISVQRFRRKSREKNRVYIGTVR